MDNVVFSCLFVCLSLAPMLVTSAPEVQFSFGRVQGVDKQAFGTLQPYYAYYGIPYARPPTGPLRFKPTEPFAGSGPNVVVSSTNFRSVCPQPEVRPGLTMSEDCLHVNVFAPVDAPLSGVAARKKVMVFIHGGAYIVGDAASYRPSLLVTDYDVIVVTIQYRLGALGFLASEGGPANFGLLDQIQALKWVKDNIGQFGGDGNDVTVFGESAGSTSVGLLALSPLAKGLFTKAILQSGAPEASWALKRNPAAQFAYLANALDCRPRFFPLYFFQAKYDQLTWDCLRSKPLSDFTDFLRIAGPFEGNDIIFGPSVDGLVLPREPEFLLSDVGYLSNSGVLDREYVIGFTNNDGVLDYINWQGLDDEDTIPGDKAGEYIEQAANTLYPHSPISNRMLDLVDFQYSFPRDDPGRVSLQGMMDLATDAFYVIPAIRLARALTQASKDTKVFLYLFDHFPQLIYPDSPVKGSNHALDLVYEFDPIPELTLFHSFYAVVPSPGDEPLAQAFRRSLTDFARTGDPGWPTYELATQDYMAFSVQTQVRQRVYAKRVSLWTEFLRKVDRCSFFSRASDCDTRSTF